MNIDTPAKIKSVFEMIEERNTVLMLAEQLQEYREKIPGGWSGALLNKYDRADFTKEVDRSFWQEVLERSSVCAGMTDREKHEFQKNIRDTPPPFDPENISAFSANAMRIFTEGVRHTLKIVFDEFTGTKYSSGHWRLDKVDNCRKIEKSFRCRAGISFEKRFKQWSFYSHYNTGHFSGAPSYNDLLAACHILDCKPAPTYANNFNFYFDSQVKKWNNPESPEIITPYFSVKAFKNGNQLVSFTRIDILELLNQSGATNQIPEGLKKKYKPEHFNRENKAA